MHFTLDNVGSIDILATVLRWHYNVVPSLYLSMYNLSYGVPDVTSCMFASCRVSCS